MERDHFRELIEKAPVAISISRVEEPSMSTTGILLYTASKISMNLWGNPFLISGRQNHKKSSGNVRKGVIGVSRFQSE